MDQVRLGIIGCGNMGKGHMGYIGKLANVKFTAAADVNPKALEPLTRDWPEVKRFDSGSALLTSGLVDAVIIATPHYFHPPLAMEAFRNGIHVLCEKPLAVTAKAAQEVIDDHKRYPKLVFAIMFQERTQPCWRKVRQLIDEGAVGKIIRATWIITDIFRSQAYYDSGGWRATWAGEGGGVLLNQCPHKLDLFQWLVGMPEKVTAQVGIGKFHRIEVEDEVTACVEFANGGTGMFITTTGEAPGSNRFEISGENGQIIADSSRTVRYNRNEIPTGEFCRTTRASFSRPPASNSIIEAGGDAPEHRGVTENFIDAILHGTELIAPAEQGIFGLELGNAMLMSGLTGKPVHIPTDRDAYETLIKEMARKSTFAKGAVTSTSDSIDASWKK